MMPVLRKAAAAGVVVWLVLMYGPNSAVAASGGRMGGSSFSSSSSYSTPAASQARKGRSSFREPYSAPYRVRSTYSAPYYAPAKNSSFCAFHWKLNPVLCVSALLAAVVWAVWWEVRKHCEKTSVVKLQVGLLGIRRSIQKKLNQIAETADTSTTKGIHYVLTETVVALLRHPEYFHSAFIHHLEEGEAGFNEQCILERSKFDEETLVNVNNNKKRKHSPSQDRFSHDYIVITILVAARGEVMVASINNGKELKEALQKIGSIPLDKTLAVEVLWTPQNEVDDLSEQDLRRDYPLLNHLYDTNLELVQL